VIPMRVHCEESAERAAQAAATVFAEVVSAAIAERGRASVALAGGSSPAAMHAALADGMHAPQIKWDAVDFFLGDERAVPNDASASNFHSAKTSLLDRVPVDWRKVHPLEAWRTDLETAAVDYERALREACPGGALDLIVMGVGEDAHILSLYPRCPLIDEDRGALVAALREPPMNPAVDRLTLTPTALAAAKSVLVLFVGAKKASAWRALGREEGSSREHPVRLLRGHPGVVRCVGDREAMP
jgi:6-phosphogluconolactonase